MRKIILVGYMAVGKTTIADLLSKKTGIKAIDLDKLIESKVGLTISEIFEQKGEIYFRKIEHTIFKESVESNEDLIISTGGGTPCYAGNHLFLKGNDILSFYLKAPIDLILERLKTDSNQRPLLLNKTDDELQEFVAKHLFERSYFYNQAEFVIAVDHKSPENITDEITGYLH